MVKISGLPVRPETNAIRVPSADHAGSVSAPVAVVSRVGSVPSASMTKISGLGVRALENTMREQSGDHAGSLSPEGLVVRRETD